MSVRAEDYASEVENAWCPGCGNFAILKAIKKTLVELRLPPQRVVICTGIGQAPKLPHYLTVNTFNGLHGREVAAATGIKLAAPDLTVVIHAGDGGAYGEGGNHLLHAMRRNIDMTLVVHDNKYYGLTKGQASPTTEQGTPASLQQEGVSSAPLNPLALAISQDCGMVAQVTSANVDHMAGIFAEAISHSGFSLVNALQPCVTWDKVHTFAYYREHCYELDEGYDPGDARRAFELVTAESDRIPLGIVYKSTRPAFAKPAAPGIDRPMRELAVEPGKIDMLLERFR